jgi:hypothetical protein
MLSIKLIDFAQYVLKNINKIIKIVTISNIKKRSNVKVCNNKNHAKSQYSVNQGYALAAHS